ncbi:hypothetical protein C0992_000376, partial [Termitomyces sp. T32_za158]
RRPGDVEKSTRQVHVQPLLLSHPLPAPPATLPDPLQDRILPPLTPRPPALFPPATVGSATRPRTPPARHPSRRRNGDDGPPSASTNAPLPAPPSESSSAPPTPPPRTIRPRTDHPGATGAPGPSLKEVNGQSNERKSVTHPGSPTSLRQPRATASRAGGTLTRPPDAVPEPSPRPPALRAPRTPEPPSNSLPPPA